MIGQFLTWWGQQLVSLLPARDGEAQRDAVVAILRGPAANPGPVEIALRRRGKTRGIGQFSLDPAGIASLRAAVGGRGGPLEVQLPPGMMLEHSVVLPLAAERDPERVLGYEMDRLTPFAASDLFWSWLIERRDRARAQLHLRLALVPRAQVAAALQALGSAGLLPVALRGANGRRISLEGTGGGRWRRRTAIGLGVGCTVLAIAAAAIPFVQQSRESRRIEAQIASLRPAVDQAEALRRRLAGAAAVQDVLAAQRARVGDPLEVIAALSDVLPDDAVLTDLSLRERQLAISGQALSAAKLIPALAADPAFRNPAFAAPVTRNDTVHREGFSIRAEAAP